MVANSKVSALILMSLNLISAAICAQRREHAMNLAT
jgi:hypothetical protein